MIRQRDIVEVQFDQSVDGNHPAIVNSNNLTIWYKNSHNNKLNIEPFKKLIQKINDSTFSKEEL